MEKGQIFSLDFLISLVAVILAIGLIIQFSELNVYNKKDNQLFDETKRVAETAGNLLVGNPDIACKLKTAAGSTISNLSNCVVVSAISKNSLGIPSGYSCKISGITVGDCPASSVPSGENFYSVSRKVVLGGTVSKKDFDNCINTPTCALPERDVVITVWK